MAEELWLAVGRQPAPNLARDQGIVQALLNRVPRAQGGAGGSLRGQPQDRHISAPLQAAIDIFQRANVSVSNQNGRVEKTGETIEKLNRLAAPIGPAQIPIQQVPSAAADYEVPGVPLYGQLQMHFPSAVAENACWWASIRMVRDTGGLLPDSPPQGLLSSTTALDILQIEAIYPSHGMYAVYPSPARLSEAVLVRLLREKGPMVAIGRFAASDQSTAELPLQGEHAVVLYGVTNQGLTVLLKDPWQPSIRRMLVSEFISRLHAGRSRLIAATKFLPVVSPSSPGTP